MSTTEKEPTEKGPSDVERYADSIANGLHELNASIEVASVDTSGVFDDGREIVDPFSSWLNYDALELVVYLAVTDPSPSDCRAIVEVLLSYGGPTCWLTREVDLGESVELVVSWWGDSTRRRVWVPNLAQALDDLAQLYREGRS